ncbi:MAG TPA: hypothetical protein PK329_04895, partial [Myxococcota bacterium]|nr:hypothetical protein [Myxococcota bacterium]HOS62479.1 hypothetical protein [Myxococcota bacterium]HRR73958.1 hypothetical protein [Myxococcota bacterium]
MSLSRITKLLVIASVLALGCPGSEDPATDDGTPPANDNGMPESEECGEALNPMCKTNACTTPSGDYGLCRLDSKLNCICSDKDSVVQDPCVAGNNPKCEPKDCVT